MADWSERVVTVAPTGLPVTLDMARAHARADPADDAMTSAYLAAAVDMVQAWTGLALGQQTVRFTRRSFCNRMPLPVAPVQSVTSVTYLDINGASQTLDTALYVVTGIGTLSAAVELLPGESWPALLDHPAAITCTLVAGYADAIPPAVAQSILLLVGDFYAFREDTIAERGVTPATLPNGVQVLLANWRIFR